MKILARLSSMPHEELQAAREYCTVITDRTLMKPGDLIVPRYSLLPYPEELYRDAANLGASLINTLQSHWYVADLRNWYQDLEGLTPRTWFSPDAVPYDEQGSFVLKGATNSRKDRWRQMMFAPTRADIGARLNNLLDDPLVSSQGIYVRAFEEFESYGEGINGLPISNEWRVFVLDGTVLTCAWYWSDHDVPYRPTDKFFAVDFVRTQVVPKIRDRVRFVVVDVAKTTAGEWRVVELNDGTMSGLSNTNPEEFYALLASMLR